MDDERRKKIEAGKLKLAEFKKKRHKNAKTKHVESPSSPRSTDSASIKSADEKLESLNSSSTDSLTMKESKVPNKESINSNLEMENSAALSEGSDDTAHLVNADTKLLSLYDQKIKKYQTAIQHKDAIIQKLTSSLESTMNANEAADSAGNKEVVYLKQEINSLQLQMKEAAEMLERQKSKLDSQHACENESRTICETGVQVEITEIPLCLSNLSEETPPLEEVLDKFSKTPDLHEKLSNYLISNATETELQHFVKDLNHSTLTGHAAGDNEAVQPVQDNLHQIYPSDFSSLSRKLETLNVVAKLIESLVNASSRYSNESAGDFSCSKFQSFFLRRLNSTEAAEPYASESESVVSDINYAEVQPECEKSFVKNSSEFSTIEKLRNRVVADDFSLVTDFLLEEMDKISVTVPHLRLGPQGDVTDVALLDEAQKIRSETTCDEYNKFIQQKSKLESRLQHLKKLDQELQDAEQNNIQRSIDSDTLTNSEDNILLEEPPLSCVSLLSLTDSEYKIEYATTDSEANFSRKVSFDMSRPAQERGFCTRCDRCFDLMQERYDDHVCIFKEALESNLNFEKMEAVKKVESEIEKLRSEKEKQVELLCEEQELKLEHVSREYSEQLSQLQVSQSKWSIERDNFLLKIESLEEEITQSSKKIHDLIEEKAEVVDLVQELQQDLEDLKVKNSNELVVEKERLETEFLSSLERLKKTHEEAVSYLKCTHIKELEERETCLNAEHSKVINLLETTHSNESATYQKKIEQLLEEKCELLAKTTQEYEAILKKNHKALVLLCNHLRAKLSDQKEKMLNESRRSAHSEMEVSFSDALDELNRSIEQGIVKFLNQNYFLSDDEEKFDETEYLSFDIRQPVSESDFPPKKNTENLDENKEEESEKEAFGSRSLTQLSERAQSEGSLESDDMLLIRSEINKLQEEFQKDAAVYEHINAELHTECQALRQQAQELEDHKKKLEMQLNEKEKELTLKESQLAAIDAGSVKHGVSGTRLSSSDLRSWQVDAAQTNSRLLHVLSDLVKTFLDIEHDINTHLIEHGLIPSRSGTLTHHDDETGHSVGSREDFASLSIGECPTIELAEDGPDLTPRAWDLYTAVGTYDTEIEGEDVVLGASRRLRLAVDHVLNLLTRAMNNQQNQDLKLLLKRNEELSVELQEESLGRDAVQMELVTAESNVRKLEAEKQRLEDLIRDLKESQEDMKRELCVERNRVVHLTQEKETVSDEMQTLKNHCDMLASRLGDPERMGVHKMLNSSDTHTNEQPELLQENSRLSNEKHSVQKNLSKERQSFLDRVHQMETALEELKAEKEEIIEMKCKEIRDLKAEMEAMEKQLQSNKKFIDEQAQEREQEREEYIKEMNKMQEVVRDKEKIQSNEAQMTKEIESLEHMLQARIEDHQNAMKKKESVENDLRQSLDKNRDLREIIEELEKQLDCKCKIVVDLQKKLASLNESINIHEKINSAVEEGVKSVQPNGEYIEHVENLKEQLASQSQEIEQMSLNQTLLHELRGQIHFLEAKVEQRARQLEAMHLSSFTSPIQSDDNSPCGSQSSEILQMPCEDGYEISPRSVHWLEIQRLEEKIGRLAHIDEELIKKNKDLELQLKKILITQTECQHENAALQEKLSEQLLQICVLKSHIEEQKHRCTTQKSQATNDRLEELQEAYEKQLENNNKLFATLQEMQGALCASQDEMQKKDELISVLQKAAMESKNQTHATKNETEPSDTNESACFKLMLLEKNEEIKNKTLEIESLHKELEKIQKNASNSLDIARELEIQTKLAEELKKENTRLKSEIEILRNEVESLNEQLSITKEEIEKEQARFETLCEEMAHLSHNRPEDMQSDKLGKNETNAKALEDAKAILTNKLVLYENQLREKNLELSVLNATVTKLECSLRASKKDLELEQVQVDTLLQELGSLTGYQKRLEHDFNVVQEMNQKKERELAILQEETDDQIKLEAEIESLEKELEEQQSIELELKQQIKALEAALDASQTAFKHENGQWRSRVENLEKAHNRESSNLKKQIEILHRNIYSDVEDIDLSEIKKEIIEAAKAFNADGSKTYEDLIYALLKKAVDIKLKQSLEKHESQTKEVNESWQQRIKSEMETRCEKLEKENLLLHEKFSEQNNRLSLEKDTQWQTRVREIENSLKKKLKEKYTKEMNALKNDLDSAMKEKDSALAKIDELNQQLWKMKQSSQDEQSDMLRRLEAKVKSKLKNNEHSEMVLRQEIEKLQEELNSKLEKEKRMEAQHREEVSNLHKFFETHWSNEMKKIQVSQIEELKKLKDSKEKNIEALCNHLFSQYGEKLKKLQDEYATQLSEERKHADVEHKLELRELRQALERRFEKEKQQVLEMKEREIKEATDSLERRYNRKISELCKSVSSANGGHSGENDRSRLEAEKLELLSLHERELKELRQELESKYKKQLQEQLKAHDAQMRSLEEMCSKRVDEAHELIKEAKRSASRSCQSDSGSNRTATPSSEMTSSDEACSSCQEDMLPGNKHILVNKIYQDGKRILSLMGNSTVPSSEKEARLWIEERQWIVNKIKNIVPDIVVNPGSLKLVVSNLVDEIRNSRQSILNLNDDVNENKEKCSQLEQQINSERSKLYVISANLSHQTNLNKELEDMLNSKSSEIMELKRILINENRLSSLNAIEKDASSQLQSENFSSNSVEYMRSADVPRSMDRFSMFIPEISDVSLHKTPEQVEVMQDRIQSKLHFSEDIDEYSEHMNSLENALHDSKSDISSMREELKAVLHDKRLDVSYETKLHGLYWVYKRSQSYNKSLVYQKKYLLKLLKGFQMTEKVTLAWLKHMGDSDSPGSQGNDSSASEILLRGQSLFRAAAFVVIAVQRMKFCVHRWRLLARIPSTQAVNAEVQTVFQTYSVFSPTLTPGDCHLSTISLSSKSTSIGEAEHLSYSQPSSNSRSERTPKPKSTSDKRQMTEYLHRLKSLQKQLGIDNFR